MLDACNDAAPEDILPRDVITHCDKFELARHLVPWVRKNPRFTLLAAMRAANINGSDVVLHPDYLEKLRHALNALGCRVIGSTAEHAHVWSFPDKEVGTETRITRAGYSEDPSIPPPQPFQVEVCRAWLREHARPTAAVGSKFTAASMRTLVSAWTEVTKAYVNVTQVNEHTQEQYLDPRVYCSLGAFLQAAIEEGYVGKRMPRTGDAKFNMAIRRTGDHWRGRTPKQVRGPKEVELPIDAIMRKLRIFLMRTNKRALEDERMPVFALKTAARSAGIIWKDGKPPKELIEALTRLGCARAKMKIRGVERRYWFRVSDMPHGIMFGTGLAGVKPATSEV